MSFEDFKQMLIAAIAVDLGVDTDAADDAVYEVLQGETPYVRINGEYKKATVNAVEYLDGKSGGEGQGEYCYAVIKFKDTGKIYNVNFSYYSYEGVTFDDATVQEVVPKEVLVTQYIPVQK